MKSIETGPHPPCASSDGKHKSAAAASQFARVAASPHTHRLARKTANSVVSWQALDYGYANEGVGALMFDSIRYYLVAYPLATLSTAAFYCILILAGLPATRRALTPLLAHPVPPTHKYLGAFDTVRGFAACLVALVHCWWATFPVFSQTQIAFPFIAYGVKAVPIFAVLSGFLIYRSVLSIRTLVDLRAYAIRRFFRIYPVYALGVALCVVFLQYVPGDHFSRAGYFLSDLFMFNIVDWPPGYANPPAWSLYIECTFYAFLPLIVVTIGRKRMLAFALIMLAAMILADYPNRVFGLWKFFLIGIVASELSPALRRDATAAFVLGVVLLAWDFGGPKYDWFANFGLTSRHLDYDTVGLGLSCGFILASLPHLPSVSRVLNVFPLRLIGVISYSVYIIQFFYIAANFPQLGLFTQWGTTASLSHFQASPQMPVWYLPLVFFPGILFWGVVSFLLVERPCIIFGRRLVTKLRAATPVAASRPEIAESASVFHRTVPVRSSHQSDHHSGRDSSHNSSHDSGRQSAAREAVLAKQNEPSS
jgi:peptidoglycan/LPS O-acetylase OafA/YrhL